MRPKVQPAVRRRERLCFRLRFLGAVARRSAPAGGLGRAAGGGRADDTPPPESARAEAGGAGAATGETAFGFPAAISGPG
ncbi:uncharacterized protein THITE_2109611 [Thermothielavioides terrestris NRRL 8126]|uniref:Uncharacterized protein n=1 Tax=Thermothielavioides terrestris (strain ATCC 38088 / NRRL 8126) TaxID=578455 RepID=G2QX15_THETT|nr:uncharacterized protein THITE_2109611 [Thermothielavioides terrestris NRRL 8126]AEO63981.1 hypothetical protein THITE_2109611 [Thermothielavioides terrestris NRRL 8126]